MIEYLRAILIDNFDNISEWNLNSFLITQSYHKVIIGYQPNYLFAYLDNTFPNERKQNPVFTLKIKVSSTEDLEYIVPYVKKQLTLTINKYEKVYPYLDKYFPNTNRMYISKEGIFLNLPHYHLRFNNENFTDLNLKITLPYERINDYA